jgi:hypothetical protein
MNVLRPGKVLTTARADMGVGPYSRLGGNVGAGSHPVPMSIPEVVRIIAGGRGGPLPTGLTSATP